MNNNHFSSFFTTIISAFCILFSLQSIPMDPPTKNPSGNDTQPFFRIPTKDNPCSPNEITITSSNKETICIQKEAIISLSGMISSQISDLTNKHTTALPKGYSIDFNYRGLTITRSFSILQQY
jgi:hypothetical protein